ncbi:MAG TPA: thiamine pyrophosphate-dependent enzyme [Candidatus Limnocylindria bacterium]
MTMDPGGARRLLERMTLIRAFEETVQSSIGEGGLGGLVHLSIGQEAVAAALADVVQGADRVYAGHRAHGHALALGAEPWRVMAELMGKADGLCRGKGGSMHLVDVAHGFFGATGVVGGNIPLALGTAFAIRPRGGVAVVVFGDGAAQSGYFHESLNIAALWRLPVVLVCENNGYAEFTPRSAHTVVERVARHAETYGVRASTVDGNDVLAVRDAAAASLEHARGGAGPALLECLTYRMRGHYEGDPAGYRAASEVADWREKDPVARFGRVATERGWLSAADVAAIDRDVRAMLAQAVDRARRSPDPQASELTEDVHG